MGLPCFWSPSPCSTLLWTVPYCASSQAASKQNRTEQISSPLRPIHPGQSRGRLGELWPMTSRTQLPIDILPNQTGRGTPAPQPEPASPLPVTRLGHQHVFFSPILLRAAPRRPNLAPSPELARYMASCSITGTPTGSCPCGCCQIPPVLPFPALPWHYHSTPIPNPIQSHSSPAQVQSGLFFALSYRLLSMDGLDGLMRDFFSLVLVPPSHPYLGTSSLRPRPRHHFAR